MAIISSIFIGKAKKSVGGKAGGTFQHYYGKTVLKQRILNTLNSTQPTAAQTTQRNKFGAVTAVLGAFGAAWARNYFARSMYGSSYNNLYKLNYMAAYQLSLFVPSTKNFASVLDSIASGASDLNFTNWKFYVSYGRADLDSLVNVAIDSASKNTVNLSGHITSTSEIKTASITIIALLLDGTLVISNKEEDISLFDGVYRVNFAGTTVVLDSEIKSVMAIPIVDSTPITQYVECTNGTTTRVPWYAKKA